MTEHDKFAYAKTMQNTLTQNHILKISHNIIQLNKSRPDVVEKNISQIRKKLAKAKLNTFQATIDKSKKLADLAAKAARVTRQAKVGA